MAARTGGTTRLLVALGCAALVATLGVSAVGAEGADPNASPTATPTSPLSTERAADQATDVFEAAEDAAPKADEVPLVTVENTPTGPKVVSHDVGSPAEARAVAKAAAKGRDLVAVDQDRPVMPFGDLVQVDLESGDVGLDVGIPSPLPTDESGHEPTPPAPVPSPPLPTPEPKPAPTTPGTAPSTSTPPAGTATPTTSGLAGGVLGTVDQVVGALTNFTYDAYSSYQWALNPAKTSFLDAWNVTKGNGVTVAVIDTGVAATHPDLAGRILAGHEFLNGGATDRDVAQMTDNCGHGTHVAGTIAAIPGNGIGVAGVAPSVKILPVRVLNCGGWSSDVAKGITWAANKGARVINLSVGGPGPDKSLAQAVKYARSKGAVVVAAAGNNHGKCTSNKNQTSYPGATTGAIGVGAIDSAFLHACFSNTGTYVDVTAPGVGIVSTVPSGSGYSLMNGTSMATPHVAGAAALILAKRPQCTPDRVEARLESTAYRLPFNTAGVPRLYGSGLINPSLAVRGSC